GLAFGHPVVAYPAEQAAVEAGGSCGVGVDGVRPTGHARDVTVSIGHRSFLFVVSAASCRRLPRGRYVTSRSDPVRNPTTGTVSLRRRSTVCSFDAWTPDREVEPGTSGARWMRSKERRRLGSLVRSTTRSWGGTRGRLPTGSRMQSVSSADTRRS